jgi:hypothetical protein
VLAFADADHVEAVLGHDTFRINSRVDPTRDRWHTREGALHLTHEAQPQRVVVCQRCEANNVGPEAVNRLDDLLDEATIGNVEAPGQAFRIDWDLERKRFFPGRSAIRLVWATDVVRGTVEEQELVPGVLQYRGQRRDADRFVPDGELVGIQHEEPHPYPPLGLESTSATVAVIFKAQDRPSAADGQPPAS